MCFTALASMIDLMLPQSLSERNDEKVCALLYCNIIEMN